MTLQMLVERHDINCGSIKIGLDGERDMLAVSQDWEPKPTESDFDMIYDIRRKLRNFQ